MRTVIVMDSLKLEASFLVDFEFFEQLILDFLSSGEVVDCAHDLDHVFRVVRSARELCGQEEAQLDVVLPAAYLHDCFGYPKNHPDRRNSSLVAADLAIDFLREIKYPLQFLEQIHHAICTHSYSADLKPETKEAKIVQDADRLDALGAIGIARCIQVGTLHQRPLYCRNDPLCSQRESDDGSYTVDHFFVKLLKIADTMQTEAAKVEAKKRKAFMIEFLDQLKREV